MTSYRGSIHSPHLDSETQYVTKGTGTEYISSSTCDWLISVAQGSSISLNVTTAEDTLEFCRKNVLRIYNGDSALKPLLHFDCSKAIKGGQLQMTSTTNRVLVVYNPHSYSQSRPEFILDYETNCNMVLDHVQGIIESPNFPDPYPELLNCKWDIKAGSNNKLQVAFSHLTLEADSMECQYDYVDVWDMKNEDILKRYHLCTQPAEPITSEGNQLSIRFVTDYSNNKMGFRAEYSRIGCGQILTNEYGTIKSPNYPYSVDLDCEWYIEVPAGKQIVLRVIEFDDDNDSMECSQGRLAIKEAKDATAYLYYQCSKQQMQSTIVSPTNRMYIHYQTGPSKNRKFFNSVYHTKDATCGGFLSSEFSTIHSPNYPLNSTEDYDCKWQITVPDSYGVSLYMRDLQFSPNASCEKGYLKISELSAGTEKLVEKICEAQNNHYKFSTKNKITIEYKNSGPQWIRFSMFYRKMCYGDIKTDSGVLVARADDYCRWKFDLPEGR